MNNLHNLSCFHHATPLPHCIYIHVYTIFLSDLETSEQTSWTYTQHAQCTCSFDLLYDHSILNIFTVNVHEKAHSKFSAIFLFN